MLWTWFFKSILASAPEGKEYTVLCVVNMSKIIQNFTVSGMWIVSQVAQ